MFFSNIESKNKRKKNRRSGFLITKPDFNWFSRVIWSKFSKCYSQVIIKYHVFFITKLSMPIVAHLNNILGLHYHCFNYNHEDKGEKVGDYCTKW